MGKLVMISAMAVFLSGMAAQAQSTISWDFDTPGDVEGWVPSSEPSMTNGLEIAASFGGFDGLILTTSDVTGGDPGVLMTNGVPVPAGEYWDTLEVRMRVLSGNAAFPIDWIGDGTVSVVNWDIVDGPIGTPGSNWATTTQSNKWIVTTLDITSIGTNEITFLRIDPPGDDESKNFEIDYIRLNTHTNAPPPPVYKTAWEFNTPADTEGWQGNMASAMEIATAVGGSESVLTTTDASGADPQVSNSNEPANLEPGKFWSTVELRIRHTSGGAGTAWDPAGTLFRINNTSLSHTIGGDGWETTTEASGWITTRLDMSVMGNENIFSMRIDPFDPANGRTIEIDYVRFETRSTPILPPAPDQLIHTWAFNSIGDTEGWTDNGDMTGLTVANTISGSEVVLTSSDVIGAGDSMLFYNEFANPTLNITPPGAWSTWEVRMRQLTGNPGDLGTVPLDPFDPSQVTFVANNNIVINLGTEVISFTPETNGWITAVFDISRVGFVDLTSLRIDPLADIDLNFEIDYTRVFSQGSKYDAWSQVVYGLEGTNALTTADADGDTFNNLYEFSFGGDPTNAADVGFVESSIVDDGGTSYVEYNYVRRTDANNGLEYTFEQRDDLTAGWVDLAGAAEVGTQKVGDDHEVVTNRIDTVADDTLFHRVKVSGE